MSTTTPRLSASARTAAAKRAAPARWRFAGSVPSAPIAPWCGPASGARYRLAAGAVHDLVHDLAALAEAVEGDPFVDAVEGGDLVIGEHDRNESVGVGAELAEVA